MKKDKWFVVREDLFKTDVLVYVGSTEGFKKRLGHYVSKDLANDAVSDIRETTQGTCFAMDDYGIFSIWLKEPPDTIEDIAILNHEAFHMAVMILKRVGISPSEESEEVYAYLIEFLTKSILSHFT